MKRKTAYRLEFLTHEKPRGITSGLFILCIKLWIKEKGRRVCHSRRQSLGVYSFEEKAYTLSRKVHFYYTIPAKKKHPISTDNECFS